MFQISIVLGPVECVQGCQALDFARKWGLPEKLKFEKQGTDWGLCRRFDVTEEFARLHFDPCSQAESEAVSLACLLPGEIVCAGNDDYLALSKDLPPERAQALFLAARLHRLRRELEAAQKQAAYWQAEAQGQEEPEEAEAE